MRAVAYYDDIYLVGTNSERTGSHRVTERDSKGRPGVVSFSGNYPEVNGTDTYGTLVLNEELWKKWFGNRSRLVNMDTAEIAAACMVQEHNDIYYGCPLCTFKSKDRDDAEAHIHEHINRFIKQFRVELEE